MWEVFCDGELLCLVTDDELWEQLPFHPAPDGGRNQIVPHARAFLALATEGRGTAPTLPPQRQTPGRRHEFENKAMVSGGSIGRTSARRDARRGTRLAPTDQVRPHSDLDGMCEAFCDRELHGPGL
jgi:hypothetical protein